MGVKINPFLSPKSLKVISRFPPACKSRIWSDYGCLFLQKLWLCTWLSLPGLSSQEATDILCVCVTLAASMSVFAPNLYVTMTLLNHFHWEHTMCNQVFKRDLSLPQLFSVSQLFFFSPVQSHQSFSDTANIFWQKAQINHLYSNYPLPNGRQTY